MFNWRKKEKYEVLPNRRCFYGVNKNGELMAAYYWPHSGLFSSTPLSQADKSFSLNIRRPIIIDAETVELVAISSDLLAECDEIIFKNFGKDKITVFCLHNSNNQSIVF